MAGNFEIFGEGDPDWYVDMYLCDFSAENCRLKCTTSEKTGNSVTWNECCNFGTVTNGQYALLELWDRDVISADDLGGRVALKLKPGGGGNSDIRMSEAQLGSDAYLGSRLRVNVVGDWGRA